MLTKAVVVLLLGLSLSIAHQCSHISKNGYTYDFSLMRNYVGDLTIQSEPVGTYYYQVCSEVVNHCGKSEAAVCIKHGNRTINAGTPTVAQWQDSKTKEDEGVTIIYSHGDVCGADGSRRKTVVQLQCLLQRSELKFRKIDPNGIPSYISSVSDDGCTARMTVMTPFACPTNKNYSTCPSRTTRDECLNITDSGSCECAWCESKCMGSNEQCDGVKESVCFQGRSGTSSVLLIPSLMALFTCCVFACGFCCVCAARRRTLRKKLDVKFRLPVKTTGYTEIPMEPLMQPPVMEPQYVYVQYPMPSGQQQPPLYAPNPVFVVPQYTQQMQ